MGESATLWLTLVVGICGLWFVGLGFEGDSQCQAVISSSSEGRWRNKRLSVSSFRVNPAKSKSQLELDREMLLG